MIGQVFKRRATAPKTFPASIRIVGQSGTSWTVQPAAEFGETLILRPAELAEYFDAPAAVPEEADEERLRAPSAEQLRAQMAGYRGGHIANDAPADDSETPEAIFRRIALEEALAIPEDC